MGTFLVTWDLDEFTGGPSATTHLVITSTATVVDDDAGIVYDRTVTIPVTAGQVALPGNDNRPGEFGYQIRARGGSGRWQTPALAPGESVDLSELTSTTPLPVPPGYDQQLAYLDDRVDELEAGGGGGGGGSATWPVAGTPSTFPPSAHTHPLGDVTGLQAALDAKETPAGAQTKATAAQTAAATDATAKATAERDRALTVEAVKADLVGGKVPTSQIASISTHETVPVASQAAMLALTATDVQIGDEAVVSGGTSAQKGRWLLIGADRATLASWLRLSAPGGVQSVNGQTVADVVLGAADVGATPAAHATDATNPHSVTKAQVGLANVDNTSDATKPVSTAQAAADQAVADAVALHGLRDLAVAGPGALTVGRTNVLTAAGTYTAPAPAASVSNPAQRFAVRNDGAAAVTFTLPGGSGATATVDLLPGMARVYRQTTANGYGLEDGIPQTQLDQRFPRATFSTPGAAATGTPSSTTFLRGDGAWATPAGGSGAGAVVSATLAVDTTVPASTTTDLLTITLPPGTWLVSAKAVATSASASGSVDIAVALGTAVGTILGTPGAQLRSAATSAYAGASVVVPVTVTTEGTVVLRLRPGAITWTARANAQQGLSGVTGIDATKIA